MIDYTKTLPKHEQKYIGENDLFLEIYEPEKQTRTDKSKPPVLFVHGAYSGSWMWSKYLPHFLNEGYKCYAMNTRGHYRSRVMDLTKITFSDYLEDIKEIIAEIGEPPILFGHSLGGTLGQKLAETVPLAGLVLCDTAICREVEQRAPFREYENAITDLVIPAPKRETINMDESLNDTEFQRKYLTMESSSAINAILFSGNAADGIPVDSNLIKCPCLVISAVNSEDDDHRGKVNAQYFHAEYAGFWNMTHTGILIGQRYKEVVDFIMEWLKKYYEV